MAYRQYKISRTKLKFDLYEKRLNLFKILSAYISEVALDRVDSLDARLRKHRQLCSETLEEEFLFDDPAIGEYFRIVVSKSEQLADACASLAKGDEQNRAAAREDIQKLRLWFFINRLVVSKVFKNDLSIRALR